ncbi:hypothetical protein KUTeg_011015 [Tegillarca granosa]|uniref:C2H2-type domain-containing protein n=1 Tax=Tegillarca granosa TaxID=220873 RepID=A0ABQ9F2N3_TEGGR|nr:hypothetical protein KUTeg_011015 [Tegillarca granosa]
MHTNREMVTDTQKTEMLESSDAVQLDCMSHIGKLGQSIVPQSTSSRGEKYLSDRIALVYQFFQFCKESELGAQHPHIKHRLPSIKQFSFEENDLHNKKDNSSEVEMSDLKQKASSTTNKQVEKETTVSGKRRYPSPRKTSVPSWTKSYVIGTDLKTHSKHHKTENKTEISDPRDTNCNKNDFKNSVFEDISQLSKLDNLDASEIQNESAAVESRCVERELLESEGSLSMKQSDFEKTYSMEMENSDPQGTIEDALKEETDKNPFYCQICKVTLKWKSSYNRHMKNHNKELKSIFRSEKLNSETSPSATSSVACVSNGADVPSLDETHSTKSSPVPKPSKSFLCKLCNTKFRNNKSIYRHFRNKHPGKKASLVKLEEDDNKSTTSTEIKKDDNISDSESKNEVPKFACTHCTKRFGTSKILIRHLLQVHKVKRLVCRICAAVFKTTADIMKHYSSIHNNTNFKPAQRFSFQCDICRKLFLSKLALQNHKELHKSGTSVSYSCIHCGKLFSTTFYLSNHLLCVHKEKKSVCRICKEYFSSPQELRQHIAKHNACIVCNKTFESSGELKNHKATHSQVLCGQSKRLHGKSNEKSYFICKICDIKFLWKHSLRRHFVNKHDGDDEQAMDISGIIDSESVKANENSLAAYDGSEELSIANQDIKADVKNSSMYKCSNCHKSFDRSKKLSRHLKQVHKLKASVCKNCGKICSSLQELNEHYLTTHNISKSFSSEAFSFHCSTCRKFFRTKEALSFHEENQCSERNMKYDCHLCGKTFVNTVYLSVHMSNVHKERCSICRICKARFPSRQELRQHLLTHKEKKDSFHCSLCGQSFPTSEECSEHKKSHPSQTFMCDICGKSFHKMFLLNIHRRTHTGETPYKCDSCDMAFISNGKLRLHKIKKHDPDGKRYQCELCGMRFMTVSHFNKHKNKQHLGLTKVYKCEHCNREFKSQEGQNNHLLNDHLELLDMSKVNFKIRSCEYCEKRFHQKQLLDAHVMIHHTGKRPITCDVCGKGFINVDRLKRHKLVHGISRRYTCEICKSGAGGNDMSKLKKHFRSVKHIENCVKLGISEEDGKIFSTNQLPKSELHENRVKARLDDSTDDVQCQVIQEVPAILGDSENPDILETELQTTECVIITLPENIIMACEEDNETALQIESENAIQHVIKMEGI